MAPAGGTLVPPALRAIRQALKRASQLIEQRLGNLGKSTAEPALARVTPRQPLHPLARIRQGQGRWFSTQRSLNVAFRRFISTARDGVVKAEGVHFPASRTAYAVSRLTTRAPFASTLRPNLTGGALPRTAGGYSLGGGANGARYFSHTPAAPAQVVQNVSMACRAFWLSGQKARYDGVNARGEKQFRTVSALQDKASRTISSTPKNIPGSHVDFQLSPVITALSNLKTQNNQASKVKGHVDPVTLNSEGFLDVLAVDFARQVRELAVVMADLKRLSTLGDLPSTLVSGSTLRVHFPGCDVETVEHLCDEVGVSRGLIHQDDDYMHSVGGDVALMFPFAPSSTHTISSPGGSCRSQTGLDPVSLDLLDDACPEGYESMSDDDVVRAFDLQRSQLPSSTEFEGLEGIYRFIEHCDQAMGKQL